MPTRSPVRLPVVARPGVVAVFVVVVALVGGAGVLLGRSMSSADGLAAAASAAPPAVDAAVERRSISPPRMLQGAVDPGDTETVPFSGISAPAVLPLVTEVGVGAGGSLANGHLLLAIAGQPRVALRVETPLYRDLHRGDVGADVEAFETALMSAVGGDFDVDETMTDRTLAAAGDLWRDLGYELPRGAAATAATPSSSPTSGAPVPTATVSTAAPAPVATAEPFVDVTQIVQLSTDPVTVLSALGVGDTATADAPLATLRTSPRRIVARATVLDADAFGVGTPVVLRADGRPDQQAAVARLGDFVAADPTSQSVSGRDVVVDLPVEWSDLAERATVSIVTEAAGADVLAVPLAAVHDASTAPFVVVSSATAFAAGAHVSVAVLGSGGGWVQIDESSGLVAGDAVTVSP